MRIAFLIGSINYGGAERQLLLLARAMHARGDEVRVFVYYPDGEMQPEFEQSGVAVEVLGKGNLLSTPRFLWRLWSKLREYAPQVLYSYLAGPNLVAAILSFALPRFVLIWGIRASNVDFKHYHWVKGVVFRLNRFLSRRSDLYISNSRAGCDYHMAHGYSARKMIVVYNGVDTQRFDINRESGAELRIALGIADCDPVIGVVARLDPMKGHETLLHAVAKLTTRYPGLVCLCVGDARNEYGNTLKSLAEHLGIEEHMRWLGSREDTPACYNAMDLHVSASHFGEGFSNAISEAMACGVPCVGTDVGDTAHIIGECGAVVPHADPEALAGAIQQTLSSKHAPQSIRKRIVSKFSVKQMVDNTIAAIEQF